MARQFIKIKSASNDEGNDLFNAICKDILHAKTSVVRNDIGLPVAQKVTTKDLITLIQEKKIDCEITVFYDPDKKEDNADEDPFKA